MREDNSAYSATIWSIVERFSSQGIAFFISIVLARLLTPEDYGTIGLIAIFIAVSQVFLDAGFGNALIRKIELSDADLSTALYFNILVGLIIYSILWLSAPLIASFFEEKILINLIRIVGLSIPISSFGIVQQSILLHEFDIKRLAITTLSSQIPSGIFAVVLAYKGFGVYALAYQTVSASIIQTVSLWLLSEWRPRPLFDKDSFRYLFSFGSRMVSANLIGTVFDQIYSVLIGKYIGKADLGYFTKGQQLNSQMFSTVSGVMQRIALPILSKKQNDKDQLTIVFRDTTSILLCINAFIASYVSFSSDKIVILLWSEKWIQSSPILSILAFGSMWIPLSTLALSLLQAVNKPGLLLKLEFPKKFLYVILIALGFYWGLIGLCICIVCINITGTIINMCAIRGVVNYSFKNQLKDIVK